MMKTSDLRRRPIDRTKREYVGVLKEIKWSDDATGAVIALLDDGYCVKGNVGNLDEFEIGHSYRFMGRWEEHDRFGPQFRFDGLIKHEPAKREALVRYLTKLCDGIGDRLAERLHYLYGANTCKVLRETPERIVKDGLLKEDVAQQASEALRAAAAFESTRIELFGIFGGRGFPGRIIDAAIEKWGIRAPDVIRRDPFRLLVGGMPGAGFKRCDRLWLDLGRPRDALKRQMLCGWNDLRNDRLGHTWHAVEEVCKSIEESIDSSRLNPVLAIKLGLRAGWLRKHRDSNGRLWIAAANKAANEQRVADHATRLLAGGGDISTLWPADLLPGPDPDRPISDHQMAAWESIRHSPLAILTGGPGTGKTFTLAAILRLIVKKHGARSVAVAAPTGKAAVRCTQALLSQGLTDLRATTIHTLLDIGRNGHDGQGWSFNFNESNPLPYRFVVVDECSMIDIDLAASLLAACGTPSTIPARPATNLSHTHVEPPRCRRCHRILEDTESQAIGFGPHCKTLVDPSGYAPVYPQEFTIGQELPALPEIRMPGTHVLLIGDPYQLPPVGHGAPLRDLIAAGVPSAELTEIRRNAGTIVRACAAIKAGQPFETDAKYEADHPDGPKNLKLYETSSDGTSVYLLEKILTEMTSFNPVWQTQVLVAVNRKSLLSRTELNKRLQKLLNPDGDEIPGNPFRLHDKIICLRNSWMQAVTLPKFAAPDSTNAKDYQNATDIDGEPKLKYVANGEIGRVVAIAPKLMVVRFSESDELVKVPIGKVKDEDEADQGGSEGDDKGQGCNCDLAYAITVHKSQGSESPCIIAMIDDGAGFVANREFWYTAVSRASKLAILIGNQDTLEKQTRRVALQRRKTFLTELLQEANEQ